MVILWLVGRMSRITHRLVVPALVSLALLMPGTAGAGVSVGIGFGGPIGPHYYGNHHWRGGWSVGLGWYNPWYGPWYGPGYGPWYGPGYGPWYGPGYGPGYGPVVVQPPVVVERPGVVKEQNPSPSEPIAESVDPLSVLRQQRSELLEQLRIGDVSNRLQAVKDLGPSVNDEQVRKALENALLSDRDAQVRKAVAELFGRLKDPKTLPALKKAYATDSDRDVRQAAYKAIILMEGYNVNGD
jgi:hypothetical protein